MTTRTIKKSKDDEKSFTALQHVYSSFTATAVNQNGKPVRPVPAKKSILIIFLYLENVIYSKTGIMEVTKIPEKLQISVSMILKLL